MDDRRVFDRTIADSAEAVEKIAAEFRTGFALVDQIDRPAVAVFGSARVPADAATYEAAREIGRRFAAEGWAVITGGGPGVMEAANRGAHEAGGLSVGWNIKLPHEQASNPYVTLGHTFEHLYARKVCFTKPSEGFIAMPGGSGTLDELYESLTLIQTGKMRHFPVVLFGSEHWGEMLDWLRRQLATDGLISPGDVELLRVTDDPAEAVEIVIDCFARRCAL